MLFAFYGSGRQPERVLSARHEPALKEEKWIAEKEMTGSLGYLPVYCSQQGAMPRYSPLHLGRNFDAVFV